MKKSELKQYIKEQILNTLQEATFQADKSDKRAIDAAKDAATDEDDVVQIGESEDSDDSKKKD